MKQYLKRFIWLMLWLFIFLIIIPAISYLWISLSAKPYLYDRLEDIPTRPVAIVLGTSKYVSGGGENLFYTKRIEAALALYRSGKVSHFIVSGSNPDEYYNEPKQMQEDLIAGGIPAENIQPDYAGLRTLDSILRAEKIFGNQSYMIVSQPFHNARAVFIARHNGHNVVAYNADDGIPLRYSFKTRIREFGARLKAISDLYFTNKQARFYGDPIPFPQNKRLPR